MRFFGIILAFSIYNAISSVEHAVTIVGIQYIITVPDWVKIDQKIPLIDSVDIRGVPGDHSLVISHISTDPAEYKGREDKIPKWAEFEFVYGAFEKTGGIRNGTNILCIKRRDSSAFAELNLTNINPQSKEIIWVYARTMNNACIGLTLTNIVSTARPCPLNSINIRLADEKSDNTTNETHEDTIRNEHVERATP